MRPGPGASELTSSCEKRPPSKPATTATTRPGSSNCSDRLCTRSWPKYVRLPNTDTATRPDSTMQTMTSALCAAWWRRESFSSANITPPSGVLKAAAMPAAAPATIRSWPSMRAAGDSQRRTDSITPAPICTVGPSRPADSPASIAPPSSAAFLMASGSETSARRRSGARLSSSATITCGMPEPAAPGAKRRVSHTSSAVSTGVHSSMSHGPSGPELRICSCRWLAASHSRVTPTTEAPVATAAASTIARSTQARPARTSRCRLRQKSGVSSSAMGRP